MERYGIGPLYEKCGEEIVEYDLKTQLYLQIGNSIQWEGCEFIFLNSGMSESSFRFWKKTLSKDVFNSALHKYITKEEYAKVDVVLDYFLDLEDHRYFPYQVTLCNTTFIKCFESQEERSTIDIPSIFYKALAHNESYYADRAYKLLDYFECNPNQANKYLWTLGFPDAFSVKRSLFVAENTPRLKKISENFVGFLRPTKHPTVQRYIAEAALSFVDKCEYPAALLSKNLLSHLINILGASEVRSKLNQKYMSSLINQEGDTDFGF